MKRKACQAEKLTSITARIHGECEHVKKLDIDYGFGCAYPARHSVVIRFLDLYSKEEKLILQVCTEHFDRLQGFPILDYACCIGSESPIRMSFRRNRF